jgi:anaerobic magnesium-protoporphyrin IX monomethyl ester cyclase
VRTLPSILLLFPPQWSAFQPSLSLPSLSAWLKRSGFAIRSIDLNVAFYEWLLSDECADLLTRQLDVLDWECDVKLAHSAFLRNVADFRNDVKLLQAAADAREPRDPDYFFQCHYRAVKSLEIYLSAVSNVSGDFSISPYDFRLTTGNLETSNLEAAVSRPPNLIGQFLKDVVTSKIPYHDFDLIGLSCIGQEQLYFTLCLGAMLKKVTNSPIIVGGTILSRIFERGVLKDEWFGRFFDVIVRNEGEKPAEALLANIASARRLTLDVPGIVYREDGRVIASRPCSPLTPSEIPIPDFDDMPLNRYLSAEPTLPLLSARGCYWGKCEFCHHGMVYGEKYAGYGADRVLESVKYLAGRYGVRHFAFNDEAIPPKILRQIGETFPAHNDSQWSFTGLIKFERFFTYQDFKNVYDVGFRSLYVGLESASERVLGLMKKNNTIETIIGNLTAARSAGIWMHCFLFFGFPGETEEDAQRTFDFILDRPDIVSSFGAGTFSLEHNAPISRHIADFGITLLPRPANDVNVYYDYDVTEGVTPERASEWMQRLNDAAQGVPSYASAGWVPRELLLCMLSAMTLNQLIAHGSALQETGWLPDVPLSDFISTTCYPSDEYTYFVVNRVNGRVQKVRGKCAELFELFLENDLTVGHARELAPLLFEQIRLRDDLSSTLSDSPDQP